MRLTLNHLLTAVDIMRHRLPAAWAILRAKEISIYKSFNLQGCACSVNFAFGNDLAACDASFRELQRIYVLNRMRRELAREASDESPDYARRIAQRVRAEAGESFKRGTP